METTWGPAADIIYHPAHLHRRLILHLHGERMRPSVSCKTRGGGRAATQPCRRAKISTTALGPRMRMRSFFFSPRDRASETVEDREMGACAAYSGCSAARAGLAIMVVRRPQSRLPKYRTQTQALHDRLLHAAGELAHEPPSAYGIRSLRRPSSLPLACSDASVCSKRTAWLCHRRLRRIQYRNQTRVGILRRLNNHLPLVSP